MPHLKDINTRAPKKADRDDLEFKTELLYKKLQSMQYSLYKNKKHSVLIVLQGLDAAGKDSTIRSVFTGVNPMGCFVKAWKVPTAEEFAHDFLWRIHEHVPPKGMIHIFNRSHYEDLIVPKINDSISDKQFAGRCKFINTFEELLIEENNTIIFKFFLHVSKEEELERLMERKSDPEKRWKYNPKDFEVNNRWGEYIDHYDEIIKKTNKKAKWQVIPADQKWYRNYLVATSLVKEMEKKIDD
ncbi:MAG: polyphosphate kinase [Candidatus Dadabacteria bacterium]|nr:polyphosphate kinase [Candidatus Dadabacteria bacterium]NIS08230.1 polyphosphate kinase [Candidatus Dadabacteria bacterium]NIV41497.1 polyphosphate kinase [Candidatus Dadabacteria bacterium]NIY21718.1 polyphosphate kinase [Candidatus Dadabacteria bacterium]